MPQDPRSPKEMPAKLSEPADWVDRYGDALLRYAAGRVSSRELAEDLVQETLLAAFRHRDQFDAKSSFGALGVGEKALDLKSPLGGKAHRTRCQLFPNGVGGLRDDIANPPALPCESPARAAHDRVESK
jgi:hypothetical protein